MSGEELKARPGDALASRVRRLKPFRARRRNELSGVGALVGVTELVRGESDLETVLALIARTVAETLGFATVVLNLYRPAWDDFCVATVHGDANVRAALLGSTYEWESWQPLLDGRQRPLGEYTGGEHGPAVAAIAHQMSVGAQEVR